MIYTPFCDKLKKKEKREEKEKKREIFKHLLGINVVTHIISQGKLNFRFSFF
jgi:hypothetical protein